MVLIAHHSDRTGERRWHTSLSLMLAAVGLAAGGLLQQPVLALLAIAAATVGIHGALAPFWSLPPLFLSGTAAAGGIALINSVGNLGGFVGPTLVGYLKTATGGFAGGLVGLALIVLAGGGLVLLLHLAGADQPAAEASAS
jgi:ACS family tartrate transporter-like MFS transporter